MATTVLPPFVNTARASGAGDVVVDLAETELIDTAIGRVIAVACKRLARRGHRLSFRSPSPVAARILGSFGLTDLVEPPHAARP